MLKLEQIKLKSNLVIVEQYDVEIAPISGGITRDPEEVKREKAMRRFRLGKIVDTGVIEIDLIKSLLQLPLKANLQQPEQNDEASSIETSKALLLNKDVMFDSSSVEVLDIPLEGYVVGKILIINVAYLVSIIDEDSDFEIM